MKNFGKRLMYHRATQGLSVYDLAKKAGVTAQCVYRHESGRGYPSGFAVKVYAEALGVSADVLLGIKEMGNDHGSVSENEELLMG